MTSSWQEDLLTRLKALDPQFPSTVVCSNSLHVNLGKGYMLCIEIDSSQILYCANPTGISEVIYSATPPEEILPKIRQLEKNVQSGEMSVLALSNRSSRLESKIDEGIHIIQNSLPTCRETEIKMVDFLKSSYDLLNDESRKSLINALSSAQKSSDLKTKQIKEMLALKSRISLTDSESLAFCMKSLDDILNMLVDQKTE